MTPTERQPAAVIHFNGADTFRKLSNIKPDAFNPAQENDKIIPLQTFEIKQGIPINHSINGIAISRNADFVLDVLGAGSRKVVVIVAIPPDFGVDMEAEYLKYFEKHRPDPNRPDNAY